MAFCTQCGKSVDNGSVFCPYCGARLNVISSEAEDMDKTQSIITPPVINREIKQEESSVDSVYETDFEDEVDLPLTKDQIKTAMLEREKVLFGENTVLIGDSDDLDTKLDKTVSAVALAREAFRENKAQAQPEAKTEAKPQPDAKPQAEVKPQPEFALNSQPDSDGHKQSDGVISTGVFFGLQLLLAVPAVGLIAAIIIYFVSKNKNLKNFSKSAIIWQIVGLVFIAAAAIFAYVFAASLIESVEKASGVPMDSLEDLFEYFEDKIGFEIEFGI